ncbi:D-alanyl-D-alanine carboxypeptidase family protein [Oryzobacter terrae]|uniref:D-alanyl-D-alanine carboxypeptidase family protein n=1 Tax=Oryzobacter terrae TaxID=1620385 RepID=UPI00366C946F
MAGVDRYATSVAASHAAFPADTQAKTVYLVSGTSPWHSLSATPAAVNDSAAVLLTRPDGIPSVVATELARLHPEQIVVVGPADTVSGTVLAQAKKYAADVVRVGGSSRYQTAQALVRHAFREPVSHAWITTGRVWTDGIAAGPAAGSLREPLITIDGAAASLPVAPMSLLADLEVTSVTIVGGTAAVSAGIEKQLKATLGADHVTRATGTDRYAVAARINASAHPELTAGTSYVANGRDFVNAMAGGFLAGTKKRPLYYSAPHCVPDTARTPLLGATTTRLALLGGEGSLRSLVGKLTACSSITAANSAWVLVNKKNPLRPKTYVPSDLVTPDVTYPNGARLRRAAASSLSRMFTAARTEGAGRMKIASGYRSYSTQSSVYRNRVATNGQAYADKWIARPGYSEHQSGLSLDIAPVGDASCSQHNCIGNTPQGAWLKKNAWKYGYILRYETGYTTVTGYNSEPWHYRYVGTILSTAYHSGGWHTLEQFLDEPAAPTY